MIVQLAVDHFLGGSHNGLPDCLVQYSKRHVGLRRRLLDDAQGPDDGFGLFFPTDLEVTEASLGLGAPVTAVINFDGPEGVGFGAGLGHGMGSFEMRYFFRNESRLTTSPGFSPPGAGFDATGSGVSVWPSGGA